MSIRTITLLEWRLFKWSEKKITGNMQTCLILPGGPVEVIVIDEDGCRISHPGKYSHIPKDVLDKHPPAGMM